MQRDADNFCLQAEQMAKHYAERIEPLIRRLREIGGDVIYDELLIPDSEEGRALAAELSAAFRMT